MKVINIDGIVINEILILSERVYLERFYHELYKETLIDLSDTEYSNNELVYKYIQHFERQSRQIRIRVHRILLCNEYKSHFT